MTERNVTPYVFYFCACATSWADLWKSNGTTYHFLSKIPSPSRWIEFYFNNYFNSFIVISTLGCSLSTYLLQSIVGCANSSISPWENLMSVNIGSSLKRTCNCMNLIHQTSSQQVAKVHLTPFSILNKITY